MNIGEKAIRILYTLGSLFLGLIIVSLVFLSVGTSTQAASVKSPSVILIVTSSADSGPGTLRQHLLDAGSGVTITFDATVFPPSNPLTIALNSALPGISQGNLTIDASDAGVILDGRGIADPDADGLSVSSHGNIIRGMQILYFRNGINLYSTNNNIIGGDSTIGNGFSGQGNVLSGNEGFGVLNTGGQNNIIIGNRIGTDISGTSAIPNGNNGVGLHVNSSYNTIGGNQVGLRNIISGNGGSGISINGGDCVSNTIIGNYIGVNISGTKVISNTGDGINISNGAKWNRVGGSNATPGGNCSGECNLISGNVSNGVKIVHSGTMSNTITGNYIGTDASGTSALPNYANGIKIRINASNNTIGGNTAGLRNIISGNEWAGISIGDSGSECLSNTIVGNYIGVDVSGTQAIGNNLSGIALNEGVKWNQIGGINATPGGDCTGDCNLISGNEDFGVILLGNGTMSNTITGNYIGTDYSGTKDISMGIGGGIQFNDGTSNNTIGGNTAGLRNIISGNGARGIDIYGSDSISNTIIGNYIGVDVSGTKAISNANSGIAISEGSKWNQIGGNNGTPESACTGECNLISGNGSDGIRIFDSGTMSNTVSGNYIGTDVFGTSALGNNNYGISIHDGPTHNFIGGEKPNKCNIISGNKNGIGISGNGSISNTVIGNYIGVNISGTKAISNTRNGIIISNGAKWNRVGGSNATPGGDCTDECNLISGNGSSSGHAGVKILDSGTMSNTICGNYIGVDISGTKAISNAGDGIVISNGAKWNRVGGRNATPGGDCTGECNLISGNALKGIRINDIGTMSNTVSGNYIGTDVSGISELGNGGGIVITSGAQDNTIGGTTKGKRNIISGNIDRSGITIWGPDADRNIIEGNYIGVDISGKNPLANAGAGVIIAEDADNNIIGGSTTKHGNVIAYNNLPGVYVQGIGTINNKISHNSIFSNIDLGIDLVEGANASMFPPVLTEVSTTTIKGIAVSDASIEIFSDNEDEGRWFQGMTTTDSTGHFTFTTTSPFTGTNVTATATDQNGNTSEFSSSYRPSRDVIIAEIYSPKQRQPINIPFTPMVSVGNGGTTPETFTVTAVISKTGVLQYEDQITVTNLGALNYRSLEFANWTPTATGVYTLKAAVSLPTMDDNPSNDVQTLTFSVADDRVDLWSKDNPDDNGIEPSIGPVWTSSDLWVRNSPDGMTEPQDPINNTTNTVYVRVRNRGTLSSTVDTSVSVYWHPPSTVIGQSWWQPIGTILVGEIEPGTVYTASIDWTPQITGVLTVPYHTCLIDVIDSSDDPAPFQWNVRASNNIVQRNVDIVTSLDSNSLEALSAIPVSTIFSIGNPYAGEQLVEIHIDASNVPIGSEVQLDFGELFERWQHFGQGSLEGATIVSGTNRIQLSGGDQATIGGIPLKGEELFEIEIEIFGLNGGQGEINISESIDGEILGGVNLQLMGGFEIYLPFVLSN